MFLLGNRRGGMVVGRRFPSVMLPLLHSPLLPCTYERANDLIRNILIILCFVCLAVHHSAFLPFCIWMHSRCNFASWWLVCSGSRVRLCACEWMNNGGMCRRRWQCYWLYRVLWAYLPSMTLKLMQAYTRSHDILVCPLLIRAQGTLCNARCTYIDRICDVIATYT